MRRVSWLRAALRDFEDFPEQVRRQIAFGLDRAAEGGKADTRRYTKRQVTWFRHQMPGWAWLAPEAVPDAVARERSR